jgi:hypothetical protein
MAGTTLNYSTAQVTKGPVNFFLDVAAPSAEMTVDSTNNIHTPDATENSSAIHLGMTMGGMDVLYRPSTANSEADELTAPYRSILTAEEVVLSPKGALQFSGGASRLTLASKLMVGATASTPSGKRKITVGGLTAVTYHVVCAIWANAEDPTKYEYILLYKSFNDAGLAFTLSRKADASSDLAFRGFADTSRSIGDQVMQWVVKT